MDKYQEKALKVYHKEDATIAAKQIAYELLINAGWSKDDIERCKNPNECHQFTIFLA